MAEEPKNATPGASALRSAVIESFGERVGSGN
jgi:hypothetical protein